MTTLNDQALRCPLCGTVFETEVLATWDNPGPQTSDLRRLYTDMDPLPHLVHQCPGCGFCGLDGEYRKGFLDPSMLVPGGTLAAKVAADYGPGDALPGALRYERSAEIALLRDAPPLTVGDRYLRAAWLHGDAENAEQEQRCRELARGYYLKALAEPRSFRRREDMAVVAYLAAEQTRRLGDTETAQGLYQRAASYAASDEKLRPLMEIARQQALEPKAFLEQ